MSLAQVLFPAPTEQGLEEWLFAHNQHHLAIIRGLEAMRGIRLPVRQIWPVNMKDPASVQIFLQEHQQLHSDFGAVLGIQGNDLSNVDFNDEEGRKSWFFLQFVAHRSASDAIGLGI